jgi:hypothetical protein
MPKKKKKAGRRSLTLKAKEKYTIDNFRKLLRFSDIFIHRANLIHCCAPVIGNGNCGSMITEHLRAYALVPAD